MVNLRKVVKVVMIMQKMKLIGSGDENCVMISFVPKRRLLFHACFLSFQPEKRGR